MAKAPTETDEIKKFLIEELGMEGDWSRLSKRKGANGETVRVFLNKDDNTRHYVVGLDDEYYTLEADGHIQFGIFENPHYDPTDKYSQQFEVHFNTSVYWKANKCLYDQQMDYMLDAILGLPDCILGEDSENSFSVKPGTTRQIIMDELTDLGYVHSPEQEAWVQSRV